MSAVEQAYEIARSDLLGNIAPRTWQGKTRPVILAGRTKFTEVWARDAAFAIPALLALGQREAVRNTLEAFYDHQLPDGQFPRRLSGMSNAMRNVRAIANQWLGIRARPGGRLRPEYLTAGPRLLWYRGRPKDVNALLLISTAQHHAHDPSFAAGRKDQVLLALNYLNKHTVDGLVRQHHFEDWEDHTMHSGHILYTNVLYHDALQRVAAMKGMWSAATQDDLRARQLRTRERLGSFWNEEKGYFASAIRDGKQDCRFSTAGNMLAITTGIATDDQRERILDNLGQAVDRHGYAPLHAPGYPLHMTPLLRLPFVWQYLAGDLMLPWVQSLAINAAKETRPELAQRLLERVAEQTVRHGRSVEALSKRKGLLYAITSPPEAHFTWGGAAVCSAFDDRRTA